MSSAGPGRRTAWEAGTRPVSKIASVRKAAFCSLDFYIVGPIAILFLLLLFLVFKFRFSLLCSHFKIVLI